MASKNAADFRAEMLAHRPLLGAIERNGVRLAVRWQQDLWRGWFSLFSNSTLDHSSPALLHGFTRRRGTVLSSHLSNWAFYAELSPLRTSRNAHTSLLFHFSIRRCFRLQSVLLRRRRSSALNAFVPPHSSHLHAQQTTMESTSTEEWQRSYDSPIRQRESLDKNEWSLVDGRHQWPKIAEIQYSSAQPTAAYYREVTTVTWHDFTPTNVEE